MLYKGSYLNLSDNSGGYTLKILNIKNKAFRSAYAKVSDIVTGVIQDYNTRKKKVKLKKKDRVSAIVVCTKKKYFKKNGIYIKFSDNICIPLLITKFIVPVASSIFTPVFYEMRYLKRFKVVYKISGFSF